MATILCIIFSINIVVQIVAIIIKLRYIEENKKLKEELEILGEKGNEKDSSI